MEMSNKNELKENLSKSIAQVTFTKTDGSIREMRCTLMSEYLPEKQIDENVRHVPRRESDNVLAVWDIDNQDWRSFRLDSVTDINYIGVNRV
jgi:hypothetical protein